MSEPKGKRGMTSTEFYAAAQRLNAEITNLLLRDFGAKPSSRDLWSFCHNAKMSSEDKLAYTQLCEKYHIDVEAAYAKCVYLLNCWQRRWSFFWNAHEPAS